MKRTLTLLMLIFLAVALQAQTDALLNRLDSLLDHADDIYAQKEAHINMLKRSIGHQDNARTRLAAYDQLFEEYHFFQFDSAMVYVDKSIALADSFGDNYHQAKSRINKASLLSIGGLYAEATSLLAEVDTASLDPLLCFQYASTLYFIYLYWADYCSDQYYAPNYRDLAVANLRRAVALLPKDDKRYDYFLGEYYIYVDRDDKKALNHYFRALKTVPADSRWYAMASFAVANNYSANGDMDRYEVFLLHSCISDLLACNRENLSLQDLAMHLFHKDDDHIKRAERYVSFAMDDAKAYNNRLRILELSQKLPTIVSTYREKLSTQNSYLRGALWLISALLLFFMVLLYFYVRANRQLSLHRHELSDSNALLSSLNGQLNELNGRLRDTNTRREQLAKLYIDLCAKYIDRLAKFEVLVCRKIKAGQVNDLLSTASSSRLSEEDATTFLRRFDAAFLDLYPSFVTEFNALLRNDAQVEVRNNGQLTTELRIFALVRLGVKESSEIAALLFYTPRTIYNYRSSFKNRAIHRDTFEDDVANLCKIIHTGTKAEKD